MALEIAAEFTRLKHENAALRGLLDTIKLPDGSYIQWRPMVQETIQGPLSRQSVHDRTERILQSIDSRTDDTSLIRKVHRYIFE